MLVQAFRDNIFPYIIQIGIILFVFSICQFAYALYRQPNWQQFFDKFKAAVFGYIVVRGAFVIVNFIDRIIEGMS